MQSQNKMDLGMYAVNYTCTGFHGYQVKFLRLETEISKWSLLNTEKESKDTGTDYLKPLLESYQTHGFCNLHLFCFFHLKIFLLLISKNVP